MLETQLYTGDRSGDEVHVQTLMIVLNLSVNHYT
jgi:hypothetical protein